MFFSRLKKEINILVFDIGSSSVNASLLSKKENEIPAFLSFSYLRLPLLENPDFKHIERHARKAIKEIAEEICKKNIKKMPTLIYLMLSVPWYFSETKSVKIQRRETFKVTAELVNKIMEDELELFERKGKEKLDDPDGIEILEKEKMNFIVNGYPIENPYGKETNKLELSIYISAARKRFVKNIEDILMHFFGNAEIKFASEPFSLFGILSEMVNPKDGYLVVDVGGEVTEIYLIRGGILEDTKSFVWGANLVIRRVASSLNIGLGDALSFFAARTGGDIKDSTDEKLSSAALGICTEWQSFLAKSLSELGKEKPLPQTLVILGGVAGSDILKKCLNSPDFSSFTILGKPFNIVSFIPENFSEKILTSGVDRKDSKMTLPLLLALSALKYGRRK
ncbi:hypothetical protein A3I27_03000 [Candidatus Giovannonibacteria bacterium RIFCSPLOWO2_02_FULL_43_11b]|uniref:SHS2 domain-containing protein n=1 Tax=Candidatus Giovannonibacteria bacterium RIFCSPHIGHO2_12_FULL_43_15 TaxID=1798341 RepID=A0A1F5WQC2_9BACT|nr:MAG: hypothetical protein A2739_03235 [Candidatus Giovannonibacteria bacterium RIFCSPHIGHO2_01_FULL_43_100]OGF67580.1 MAG: hypothetical protein A3B97_00765 [Candidatus Giovannonibacteria bacterium RIFCSPHIGHO2_02_FULL_43_32]OGF77883.1 MAG: hypothetical protein A3F23_02535 [Candidatus Giovannonibacteria bacterium RIFCSPHIGHO2_12_FULL_43_15]OGF79080.1 MAG: hypothetical protein A3A15_03745 [Candidatus Giovannonibacteria bacterium RIFCSPLOWO2_01_FULL_43_60]OGF89559.1 MAG: hypothetical protein A3